MDLFKLDGDVVKLKSQRWKIVLLLFCLQILPQTLIVTFVEFSWSIAIHIAVFLLTASFCIRIINNEIRSQEQRLIDILSQP